jgi:hypothetical protein
MIMMKMKNYLGKHVSSVLEIDPFKNWLVERSVEKDLKPPRVYYIFKGRGLDMECDCSDIVCTIFIRREVCDGFRLSEIPFTLGREEVIERLGAPSKSGERSSDPVLGDSGAWDRFAWVDCTIHVEYTVGGTEISMITLMRSDIVP